MSQSTLAKAIGTTFQQVQKYEKGTNRIGASRLHLMCRALDVSPTYFFEGCDDEPVQVEANTAEPRQGLSSIDNDRVRRAVENLIKAIVKSEAS
ncbi:helix-turn-helix domain-containing protein [Consotaella aegiceratis]|uniref:helix-turn-helix domain-containing protein n=1 Tax=Consotaella aegiceratis TaxID=3097961 RepID=UPI003D802433